jgi:methyl-galactoside transport system substrate-binding protein
MNKKLIPAALMLATILCSCGSSVANKNKPLVFFNRQPSDPDTGVIDMDTMNYTDKTFYVGFDAAAGGTVQGKMVTDYLATKTKAVLDPDGDGYLGYVLCIGDPGHNDSKARTLGVRTALGTVNASKSTNAGADQTVEGTVTVKDGTLKVKELDSKAMTGGDGSTWNADAAKEATTTWVGSYAAKINLFLSNNDGMAMGCLSNPSYPKGTPIFGYDANSDAIDSIIAGGKATTAGAYLTGTVSQNVDAQAAGTLQVVRNIFDGLTGSDVYTKGFSAADQYGNKITPSMAYVSSTKAILAANAAVTADNASSYVAGSRDAGIKDITSKAKNIKLWIDLYNGSDNFLSSSYKPALEAYAKLMNITMTMVNGDGQSENSVSDNFVNLGNYDAYAINMVKTNSGSLYTGKLG